jgi:hypothetical protein
MIWNCTSDMVKFHSLPQSFSTKWVQCRKEAPRTEVPWLELLLPACQHRRELLHPQNANLNNLATHINHLNRGEGHERISVANNASEAKRLHRMGLQSILYLTPTPSQQKGERTYFIGRGSNLVIEQASNGGWNPTRCVNKAKGRCELSKWSWILEALAKGMMDRGHGGRRKAALFWLRSEVGGRRRGRPTETTNENATKSDNKTTNEKWETTTVVMASPKFLFSSSKTVCGCYSVTFFL